MRHSAGIGTRNGYDRSRYAIAGRALSRAPSGAVLKSGLGDQDHQALGTGVSRACGPGDRVFRWSVGGEFGGDGYDVDHGAVAQDRDRQGAADRVGEQVTLDALGVMDFRAVDAEDEVAAA